MSALEIVLLSVVSLLGLLILFYMLYLLVIKAYMENRVDKYTLTNKYTPKGGVVFLGDSLTEMYPVHDFFPCGNIVNRGISGNTSLQVLKRLEENVIVLKPKKVFLLIGTNDLSLPNGKPEKVFAVIKQIIEKLQSAETPPQIVMLSEIPVNRKAAKLSFLTVGRRSNTALKKINSLLEPFCNEKCIPFVDLFTPLCNEEGRLEKKFTTEGLHLSVEGYRVISEIIRSLVCL